MVVKFISQKIHIEPELFIEGEENLKKIALNLMGAFLCVVCFVYFSIDYMDKPHYENIQDYTVKTTMDEMFFDSQIKLTFGHSNTFFNTTEMKMYFLTLEGLFQRGITPKYFILEIDYTASKDLIVQSQCDYIDHYSE